MVVPSDSTFNVISEAPIADERALPAIASFEFGRLGAGIQVTKGSFATHDIFGGSTCGATSIVTL